MQLVPYLTFDGQCEAAIGFYEKALGGRIEAMLRFADAPEGSCGPDVAGDRIMHACLLIGDQRLMASDAPADHRKTPQGFHVSLHIEDQGEAERVFNALSEKGTVTMPFAETFWAIGFGMLVDRFGIPWMVNCPRPA